MSSGAHAGALKKSAHEPGGWACAEDSAQQAPRQHCGPRRKGERHVHGWAITVCVGMALAHAKGWCPYSSHPKSWFPLYGRSSLRAVPRSAPFCSFRVSPFPPSEVAPNGQTGGGGSEGLTELYHVGLGANESRRAPRWNAVGTQTREHRMEGRERGRQGVRAERRSGLLFGSSD